MSRDGSGARVSEHCLFLYDKRHPPSRGEEVGASLEAYVVGRPTWVGTQTLRGVLSQN